MKILKNLTVIILTKEDFVLGDDFDIIDWGKYLDSHKMLNIVSANPDFIFYEYNDELIILPKISPTNDSF